MSIPKKQTYEWLLYKHYAKRIPSINYSFGLYRYKNLVGVCTVGVPASRELQKCCGDEYPDICFELNRLVKDDELPKNVQSYFLGQVFRLLPKPMILVSYSDPLNGHFGYSYQATNWYYTGRGGSDKEYSINGHTYTSRHMNQNWFISNNLKWDNNLGLNENFMNNGGEIIKQEKKYRYIKFLGNHKYRKIFKRKLKWKILPYPKGDNQKYNASYKTVTQQDLFV